jgi:hypothetical protein
LLLLLLVALASLGTLLASTELHPPDQSCTRLPANLLLLQQDAQLALSPPAQLPTSAAAASAPPSSGQELQQVHAHVD